MSQVRHTFKEVYLSATKSGKCSFCNKRTTRSTRFSQTFNPFNLNANGQVKSREEIYLELKAARETWKNLPVLHQKCEDKIKEAANFIEKQLKQELEKNFLSPSLIPPKEVIEKLAMHLADDAREIFVRYEDKDYVLTSIELVSANRDAVQFNLKLKPANIKIEGIIKL